jgi:hypothetical protein
VISFAHGSPRGECAGGDSLVNALPGAIVILFLAKEALFFVRSLPPGSRLAARKAVISDRGIVCGRVTHVILYALWSNSISGLSLDDPVLRVGGLENDLVWCLLADRVPKDQGPIGKVLFHHWSITGVPRVVVDIVSDEVEEGPKVGKQEK